jgi:lysozyme family protein
MAIFETAVEVVLKHEGGYVNDPHDPGGETNFGISKRVYASVDIKNLTKQDAANIYKRDYWSYGRFGEIHDQAVATKAFDMAVLCGIQTSVRCLQNAVAACGHPMAIDGKMGPATLAAVNAIPPVEMLTTLKQEYAEHFRRLVRARPDLGRYLGSEEDKKGWLGRAFA